jgi:hypothetical protein
MFSAKDVAGMETCLMSSTVMVMAVPSPSLMVRVGLLGVGAGTHKVELGVGGMSAWT